MNRMSYLYYASDGSKIILTPGKEGVTETDIKLLHMMDDAEVDEQRRFAYFTVSLDTYCGSGCPDDYSSLFADSRFDPERVLLEKEDERERQARLDTLRRAMRSLRPKQ